MSINRFNSLVSKFYPQSLPSINTVKGQESVITEIVQKWNVNGFTVSLIKEQNSLKYKTIDKNQKEIYAQYIEIPEEENLEDLVSHLQGCAVMIGENGIVNFLTIYNTWENINNRKENLDVSLIRDTEGLFWNIFNKTTNESYFLDFQKTTIPSLQCHPETIALIEKIKTEALNNRNFLCSLIRDFKVRITDVKELKENLNKEQEKFLKFQRNYRMFSTFPRAYTGIYPYISYGSAYLFRKTIISVIKSANNCFSNRFLGATAGFFVGVYAFSLFGNLFTGMYWLRSYYSFTNSDTISNKEKTLQKSSSISLENPLLIEMEPISAPSRIDKRMGVSKFMWAVTLITHKGSEGNHAKIIVEGINDGFYSIENPRIKNGETIGYKEKFTYMTEFNPPIVSKIFSEKEELLYETRTEIWMRASNEVKKMLENIEEEKRINSIKFRIFGESSLFYVFRSKPYHNCFTWARQHLNTLNIDLGKGYTDVIGAIVKGYTINKKEYETDLPALKLL